MNREQLFNQQLMALLNSIRYEWRTNPVMLGGSTGSDGGSGGNFVGQLPQKRVTGDTTESFEFAGSIGNLKDNLDRIRAWERPTHGFWADVPTLSNYLTISSGSWYHTDGVQPLCYAGGDSPTLTAPSSGSRFDLLTINYMGELAWTSSAEGDPPARPPYPTSVSRTMALWTVLSRSSGSHISRFDDGVNHFLFEDSRPFLGAPTLVLTTGSAYIDYRWFIDGALSVDNDFNGIYYIPDDFHLTGSLLYVNTPPSSGSVICDIQYSANQGVDWISIYSTKPALTSGSCVFQAPNDITLSSGDFVRANIDDPGTGAETASLNLYGTIKSASGGGTVSIVSVNPSDGIIASVTNPTTTPTIVISLGNITPDSVNTSGNIVAGGTVTGSNLSGTNTGDQTITLTGDLSGSGTGTINAQIGTTGVIPGYYEIATLQVDVDGRLVYASSGSSSVPLYPYNPEDIAGTADIGSSGSPSPGDHVHRGVRTIYAQGYSEAFENIQLIPAGNMVITQSSGSITFDASGSGGSMTFASIAESNAGVITDKAVNPAGLPLRVVNGALIHNQDFGGDARGQEAVDFQTIRYYPTRVASGITSFIGAGQSNVSSGSSSAIVGGEWNEALSDYGFVGGGTYNRVLEFSEHGAIAGGAENDISSGSFGAIGGGVNNIVANHCGTIPGGFGATTRYYGQLVHASGFFDELGDAQGTVQAVLRGDITFSDTNWHNLYLDGASAVMAIASNSLWTFDILISGATSGVSTCGSYRIVGSAKNSGGTVSILAQTVTSIYEDDANWNVRVVGSSESLLIQVMDSGASDAEVFWVAAVSRTAEVIPIS